MHFTLRQLEIFLEIASCQNITQAAKNLAMSQSAASEALKGLEHQYEVQLFDRIGKRLRLNSLGHSVRAKAQVLIEHARALEFDLKQGDNIGELAIGATLSIGNYLAVHIMGDFLHAYPESKVNLKIENTTKIAERVLNFDLDLGLVEGEYWHDDLHIAPWCNDELVVFCTPDNPLAALSSVSDEELKQVQWVLREEGSGTRQVFDRAMSGLVSEINVFLELPHTEAIKGAVKAGLGIGCLSAITLRDEFERRELIPLSIPQRNFQRKFYFITHKKKYRSSLIELWLDFCRNLKTM